MEVVRGVEQRFACQDDALGPGETLTVPADGSGGVAVALYRNEEGELFATADTCTHEEWSLGGDSDLEGNEIVCPLHMARFDIRSGEALCFPATVALQTFEVVVEDGRIYVLA